MSNSVSTPESAQQPERPARTVARTVAQKMGIKPGSLTFLLAAPPSALLAMQLPSLAIARDVVGEFDYLHLFTTTKAGMAGAFPELKGHLAQSGMLWVSWPKARKRGTDLTLAAVIRIGYSHGLVESTCLSVDETWSALKFTHPKPGKTYNNSYGTLHTSRPPSSLGPMPDSLGLVHD